MQGLFHNMHTVGSAVLTTALALMGSLGQVVQAQTPNQQIGPMETVTGGVRLSEDASERVYVADSVFMHLFESQIRVYDGGTGKFLGLIPMGYGGHMRPSRDGTKVYTSTTYYTRQTRGERIDVVEIWDARTLTFEREVILPIRRAQTFPYRYMFHQTTDDRFLLIQNATPAVSVSVVDVEKGIVTEPEITATAGCWAMIPKPNKPHSFMSICGDGALLSIDLDDDGKVARQSRSPVMFPVATDPVFITAALEHSQVHFVSFNGNVYTADFSQDTIRFSPVWSLLDEVDKAQGWRPGGYNIADVHHDTRRMYVLMHPDGREGSHKNPAAEIWVYDLTTRQRVARIPGNDVGSLTVAQGDQPRLLTIDGQTLYIYDISGNTPTLLRTMEDVAETSGAVYPHPVRGS